MATTQKTDWYERRHELRAGMVFRTNEGSVVKLDNRVPGDGTDWYVADWYGHSFSYEDTRIHPADLGERLADDFAG